MMIAPILSAYGLNPELLQYQPIGSGLIHRTWKVIAEKQSFILQQINTNVFANPNDIAHNISRIDNYLRQHSPNYLFIAPLQTLSNEPMVFHNNQYYRLFNFAEGSYTADVVQTAGQAYEAAQQFGRFTHLLQEFDAKQLKITIPHFHDLSYRYEQFTTALERGNKQRMKQSVDLIAAINQQLSILHQFEKIKQNKEFKIRVTHHDTKISNILFNEQDKGLCVIDLDTVMPGYFISDVGDMMRTYLSPANEEEKDDWNKIEIRTDVYKAIADGYCSEMHTELTEDELQSFVYAGKFMIYMQAMRFLTDYLQNDIYYGARYELHNFNRTKNQLILLQRLMEKEPELSAYSAPI